MSWLVSRSVCSWKESNKMRNEINWEEEVSSESLLKWCKLAKNGAGMVSAGSVSCEATVQIED